MMEGGSWHNCYQLLMALVWEGFSDLVCSRCVGWAQSSEHGGAAEERPAEHWASACAREPACIRSGPQPHTEKIISWNRSLCVARANTAAGEWCQEAETTACPQLCRISSRAWASACHLVTVLVCWPLVAQAHIFTGDVFGIFPFFVNF